MCDVTRSLCLFRCVNAWWPPFWVFLLCASMCLCMCFCQFGFPLLTSGFLWSKILLLSGLRPVLVQDPNHSLPGHPEKLQILYLSHSGSRTACLFYCLTPALGQGLPLYGGLLSWAPCHLSGTGLGKQFPQVSIPSTLLHP